MPVNKRSLIIGITGGIGSGKTSVCKYLESKGYTVIYSDDIVRELLSQSKIIDQLALIFGDQIVDNGNLNKTALAELVFGNPEALKDLNNHLHPLVLEQFDAIKMVSDSQYLFFEVPLLFEASLQDCFDFIIVVISDTNTRINRVMKRDNRSSDQVNQRISAQTNPSTATSIADYVIINDDTLDGLYAKVDTLIDHLPLIQYKSLRNFVDS